MQHSTHQSVKLKQGASHDMSINTMLTYLKDSSNAWKSAAQQFVMNVK